MSHLTTDRLAELGDALPTPDEARHLAACASCAEEQAAYVALLGLAHADRSALGLPLTRWETIASGLALPSSDKRESPPLRRRGVPWPMQIAAGLLLCAGGAMLGRASAGAPPLPQRGISEQPAVATAAATSAATTTVSARPAADSARFASIDEARAAQERSELLYEQAAAFLAQHDSASAAGSPVAYRSRLAALDRVISTTREALREAPHDPVINDYYLTTIGQREATLRQLNTALPASLRLNSF